MLKKAIFEGRTMKEKLLNFVIALLGFLPLAIWSCHYINFDLWYDEVYSLEHFTLTDFKTTLFYYPAPNNHIFFNLTSQLISRAIGMRDIFVIADHVYIFRLFQLLITLLTAYFSMRIVKRYFNCNSSILIFVVLFTTIPLLNFSLQLRGYNMSSLFLVMLIYFSWSYIENKKRWSGIVVLISSFLLLYTIPSNVYFLATFWIVIFIFWVYYYKRKQGVLAKKFRNILMFIAAGSLLSMALYLPIIDDVIFNKFSNREAQGAFYSFKILFEVIPAFLTKRYLLLPFMAVGLFVLYKTTDTKEKLYFVSLITLFFIPFILSFLHQKAPFSRVFITLAPVFGILTTILIAKFIDAQVHFKYTRIIQIVITVYCVFIFVNESERNHFIIAENLVEKGKVDQGLYRNYYLGNFYAQDSTMKYLKSVYRGDPVFKLNQLDQPSTDMYLNKYQIPFTTVDSIGNITSQLIAQRPVYILTTFRKNTLDDLEKLSGITFEVLTNDYTFTNIIRVIQTPVR